MVDAYVGPTVALTLRTNDGWGAGILHVAGYPDCTTECTYDVPQGATVVVTAEPMRGQAFAEWLDECAVNVDSATCTLVLDQPRTASAYFTGGTALGSVTIGGAGELSVNAIAATAGDDVIVCGQGNSTLPTTAGGSAVVYGAMDAFIGRMHPDGSFAWITRTRGAGAEYCTGVATDSNDAVYVTGTFETQLQLGDTTLTPVGNVDAFVASLEANGTVRWVVRPSTAQDANDPVGRPIVHSNGKVYVPTAEGPNAVVLELATANGADTRITLPATGAAAATTVAEAPDGDIYVGGWLAGALGVPERAWATGGDGDLFVARISTTGAIAWAQTFGNDTSAPEGIDAMTSDAAGNIYLGGFWWTTVSFPSRAAPSTSLGSADWYVLSYDAFGNPRWARTGGGAGYDQVSSLAVNASGTNLYLAGNIFETGTNPAATQSAEAGEIGVFLARVNAAGPAGTAFARSFLATGGSVQGLSIALQNDGVAIAGSFDGTSTLGMGASAPALTDNGIDGFVHFSGL